MRLEWLDLQSWIKTLQSKFLSCFSVVLPSYSVTFLSSISLAFTYQTSEMSNIFECQYLQCFSFDCWNSSLGLPFWSHSRTQCVSLLEISFQDRSHLLTWFHQLVMTFPCVPKDKQPFKYSLSKALFFFFISKESVEDLPSTLTQDTYWESGGSE